ncbi:hypothetical protein FIBSPDRAFT_960374 [Athelia psychrophila]|uniref:Uncharacterized protein n=1 Tax=Athelia psychrophila TaxID=1759441 RepID=A0A166CID5_9AGAM|nr:hypothetical protein FIBSPDRAFT_960374 [Fibularhizoctonia sp. CBS 109695]
MHVASSATPPSLIRPGQYGIVFHSVRAPSLAPNLQAAPTHARTLVGISAPAIKPCASPRARGQLARSLCSKLARQSHTPVRSQRTHSASHPASCACTTPSRTHTTIHQSQPACRAHVRLHLLALTRNHPDSHHPIPVPRTHQRAQPVLASTPTRPYCAHLHSNHLRSQLSPTRARSRPPVELVLSALAAAPHRHSQPACTCSHQHSCRLHSQLLRTGTRSCAREAAIHPRSKPPPPVLPAA